MTETEIMEPWETFNIDFTNPCYLCKHPSEKPNRNKKIKCNAEECEWLKVWMALRKALYEINRKNAENEHLKSNNRVLQHLLEKSWQRTDQLDKLNKTVKAEAIKDFAEKVQAEFEHECVRKRIWQIAKEMGVEL